MATILRKIGVATTYTFVLFTAGCSTSAFFTEFPSGNAAATVGVDVVPTHHLGNDYSVEDVYVNGQWGGDAGREGGGGGYVCCVLLPSKWRPGLVARVKWRVRDWRQENKEETKSGIYRSVVDEGVYVAFVPVEYYGELGSLYIHFFPGAKARIVASMYGAFGKGHPISESPDEQKMATAGVRWVKKQIEVPTKGAAK